ncbi:UNVERIFIED_CONTAM: PAS domain-containing protein [Methylobacteriaceae bacterium AG10]|nr:PAS domain-containing protein [Methylobacteriaceae bacterium AG10]
MENKDDWHLTDRLNAEHGKGDPFAAAVRATRMPMIITNPKEDDNPIIFANDAFLKMTGYTREEVNGQNCRFLQGPETNRDDVTRIRDAIEQRTDIGIDLLNYRKDGTTFWNALYISPVSNEAGELQYFFASQLDVTDRKKYELRIIEEKDRFEKAVADRTADLIKANNSLKTALAVKDELLHEVDHRVKNNMQIISSLIGMQLRTIDDQNIKASLQTTLGRVEAMSTVHRRFYQSGDVTHFDIAAFVHDLASDLVVATGRPDIRLETDLEPVQVPAEKAAPLALMVNELATNAIKHGLSHTKGGVLSVTTRLEGERCRITVADDGPGMTAGTTSTPTYGKRLVERLAKQLQAELIWTDAAPGLRVEISVPVAQRLRGQ